MKIGKNNWEKIGKNIRNVHMILPVQITQKCDHQIKHKKQAKYSSRLAD